MKKEDCKVYWRKDCDGPNSKCENCPKHEGLSNTLSEEDRQKHIK